MRYLLKKVRGTKINKSVLGKRGSKRFQPNPPCEALEERRLMSLTIEVRNTDGTTATATATSVGQVINLEVLAVISSSDGQPSGDGLQDATGSFVSTALFGHAVTGSLHASNISPFRADGAQPGTQQDLNGDGNLDDGSTSKTSTEDYFIIRSSPIQTEGSGTGTVVGDTLVFEIATLTYTVTNLNDGGETSINFVPFDDPRGILNAGWAEDGNGIYPAIGGVYQAGSPFIISNPALVVAPVAVNDTATVTKNTPATINELSNDDVVVPLNDASVTIGTAPAHGTTVPQANGSILFTPTAGYVGADSFTYTVADTDGRVSNSATVSITVANAPPPNAVADTASDLLNQPVTISVLANDTDPAGATITPSSVAVATGASHGTAVAQANGTIIYTPATGFIGTDTFTYTETDSNQETSAAATVTVNVTTPIPPAIITNPLAEATTAGAPITIDVLSNVTVGSAPLAPATVTIATQPTDGTAVAQANGSILYTPTPQFTGSDSFTFTVADTLGDVSLPGTVAITITHGVPPTAANVTAPVLSGGPTIINVISSVTSGPPVVPGTVKVVTAPTNGTATVNTDGTISYTPVAGYIGTDSFTYSAGNANGDTSAPATVSVNVGTSISNAKASAHSLSFTDATGGFETITLNKGTADIFFTGTGSLTVTKAGKATVTGASLQLGSISLTGTTKASALAIKGSIKAPATLGGITDTAPLGSISAPGVQLAGPVALGGLGSMVVGSVNGAALNFNTTANTGVQILPRTTLTAGTVTDSSMISTVPITSMKIGSWTNTDPSQSITAPSIGTLTVAGGFDVALVLTNANPKVVALNSAKITGALAGTLNVSGGSINTLAAGSVALTWTPVGINSLKSLTVKTGGLASALTANTIGTLSIGGDLTGNITASSLKMAHISGGITNSTITINGATGQILAGGVVSGSSIITTGNIQTVSAGSFTGSRVEAGVPASDFTINGGTIEAINLTGLGAANLGTNTIGSVRAGSFTNSYVLAGKINSASLGAVTTANNGVDTGLAAITIGSFSGNFSGTALRLSRAQLANEVLLQAYVQQKGVTFADFAIQIAG